jgi:hypothetical protein
MAFSATLHIDEHPKAKEGIKISSFSFGFSQGVNQIGRTQSKVTGGIIEISIPNLNDHDILLWMLSQQAQKKGKIIISSGTADGKSFQVVKFGGAFMVSYQQTFHEATEVMTHLTLSCGELDISGANFQHTWSPEAT